MKLKDIVESANSLTFDGFLAIVFLGGGLVTGICTIVHDITTMMGRCP